MGPCAPKVSVIVPVFNSERFLREALGSIVAQEFADLELLVIDDGSATHACEDIVAETEKDAGLEMRYLRQEHGGVAVARNRGLMEARGDFVAYLDSDDLYEPSKLTRQLEILQRLPQDYAFVAGGCEHFVHDAPNDTQVALPPLLQGTIYPALLDPARSLPWAPSAHLFRRAALVAVGGYDRALRYGEDKELLIRLARAWKGVTHRDVVYRKRLHGRQVSLTIEPARLFADVAYLSESLRAADPKLPERLLRRMRQDTLLSAARGALRHPVNHARFGRLVREAVRHGGLGANWSGWKAVCAGYAAMLGKRLRGSGAAR